MQVAHHFIQRGGFEPLESDALPAHSRRGDRMYPLDYSDTFDPWTTSEHKRRLREQLEQDRQAFLAAGGTEQQIPFGVSAIKDRPPPKKKKCNLELPFYDPEVTYPCVVYDSIITGVR